MTTETLPERETWNLEAIFPDATAFEAELRSFREDLPALEEWPGTLDRSPDRLADALDAIDALAERFAALRAFASMKSDGDTTDAEARALRQRVELVGPEFSSRLAFLRPELLQMDPDRVERALAAEPRLAPHAHFLRDLMRQKAHVLEPGEERILAEAGLILHNPSSLFTVLNNAELPRPEFTRTDGTTLRLNPVEIQKVRISPDREERHAGMTLYMSAYADFAETFARNLLSTVQGDLFRARARRYPSCLAAAMGPDNVPVAVYENLIRRVREEGRPALHRYLRTRARFLGVERLEYHDLYCPLSRERPREFTTEDARRLVLESAEPLGAPYVEALRAAFETRWIDWHPRPGKRSGAYASGWAYRVHPYVLLNFLGDYDSVSTLAHEMGHAMHSHFSNGAQPFATADYSIFVAEVASTLNEALLMRRMLDTAESDAERRFLLATQLDGIRGTLFRQTMFAEFELRIHREVEEGRTLTGASLNAMYLELLREYHGHDEGVMHVDEAYRVEWAAIPHFHYNFYVYQYATGIVAAQALAGRIVAGDDEARERYLRFLASGGSDYPLELLRSAGVDLESADPYREALASVHRLIDELDSLRPEG